MTETRCLKNVTFLQIIYINDLPNNLNSNVKLLADDMLLFSVVHNITDSANLLNRDLSKINEWTLQWTMSFNPDPTKKAQEIIPVAKPQREITQALCLIIT